MKYPKDITTYCPKCGKHSEFAVSLYRKGRDRGLAAGNRRYARKQEGYGGQRKPKQRKTAKTTKKQEIILRCKTCGLKTRRLGIRLRKLEISA